MPFPYSTPPFNPQAQAPGYPMGDPGVTGLPGNEPEKEGILQRILGALGGNAPAGGLLDPAARKGIQNQYLLNLGTGLLAGSGSGQRFGAILGQSLQGAQQAKAQAINDQIREMLLMAQIKKSQQPEQTAAIQEYEYAKANGYQGSFEEWKQSGGGMGAQQDPAAIQEFNFYSKLTPEQQKQFLQIKRGQVAGTVAQIEGAPALVNRVTGEIQALSTPERELSAAEQKAQATATGSGRGEAAASIETKQPAAASMEYVLGKLEEQISKTAQGGVGGYKGKIGAVTDYKDATRFDNLREQLSTELRTVYRIPGEGTLSDREQQQYGIQLPSRNNDSEVNQQIIEDLRKRTSLRLPQSAGGRGASASFETPSGGNRVRVDAKGNVVK